MNALYSESDLAPIQSNGYPGIYLPLIGNGYMSQDKGVRSDTMFVSGIFNNKTTSPSHRARIPASFAITVDDEIQHSDLQYGALLDRFRVRNLLPV